MDVKIENLAEVLGKMSPALYADALRKFWERAAETVLNYARLNAPVDTGRMRSSLAKGAPGNVWSLDNASTPQWMKIGTNVNRNGFSYPKVLEESDRYHYIGGGAGGAGNLKTKTKGLFSGKPTKGWFSGSFTEAKPDIGSWVKALAKEIGAKWAAR